MTDLSKAKPADELEIYETIVAAYPEVFGDEEKDQWYDVMDFVEEKFGMEEFSELLGRLVYLTMPMFSSPLSKEARTVRHCLGPVERHGKAFSMMAGISRDVE